MLTSFTLKMRPWWAAVGVLAALCLIGMMPSNSVGNPPDAKFTAQLDAGEFAAATAMAQKEADPQQRDVLLAKIAVAQAQAGANAAAVRSVAAVGDDRARAHILAQIGNNNNNNLNNNNNNNQQGGNNQADFESLINLMQTTVAPKTWEPAGGIGTVSQFPTGVWVDPKGVLRPLMKEAANEDLAQLRANSQKKSDQDNARKSSPLRMVSLTRLEKQIQLGMAMGQAPTETMQVLAGLQRIQYVFVYPESGDLVVAGPAGDWAVGAEQRVVSVDTGAPVLRLDDVVVIFRHMMSGPDAMFGCKITPRQEALAHVQSFLKSWSNRAVPAEGRRAWLEQLRSQLGKQDIEVYGLDPRTRAARIMVEADYRMKLVGMGLEEGVPGVVSYLNLIKGTAPAMGVLRWWFTLNYESVQAAKDHQAFALRGQGAKVESENELLTAQGQRVHTGDSEVLNRQFAKSFTENFQALCQKYPIYAELRNLCDLALTASLIREEGLADKVGWHMACFGNPDAYAVELGSAPKEVETVVNYRVMNGQRFIAGVSGGVSIRPASLVKKQAIENEPYPQLENQRPYKAPKKVPADRWWWD
jgi:hypothetical protein